MAGDGRPGPTDAWLTIAALGRETSRIRLGTLVSPATFRLPGPLAISVAQADQMSGGRVELGLGAGWFGAEHEAYGIPFPDTRERFDRFAEQVEIVHGLLTTPEGEHFDFDGRYYRLAGSPARPKPVQQPHPPLILGGAAKRRGAELAARFADEYNAAFRSPEETAEIFDRIRGAADRPIVLSAAQVLCAGRDDAEVAQRAAAIGREVDELREHGLTGSPAEIVDRLGAFAEIGATRMYLQVLDLADLDHLELASAEISAKL
jgi:alkanesulfonate monooxygenase SsuD/methylene tetrahydromethanopterin reductase-like flavin-dependent oxidoreductase (luciferase family)